MEWVLLADADPVVVTLSTIVAAVIAFLQQRMSSDLLALKKRCESLEKENAELKERQDIDGHVLTTGLIEINHQGIIVEADPLGCVITGWKHDELMGCPITVLMPDATEQHRRDRADHLSKFATAVKSPWEIRRRGLAVELKQHDGQLIKVWVTLKGWGQNEKARFLGFIRPRGNA